eukprot:CAMPEP_0202785568 /NCGR_PEP_ID=MMETSP1388-20130828/68610_1 /ASSEMBLY_ACC=CAM_ASM_000864 /TAXON_ID=37098 /ORGANISM="Isochrysis sp, Strain CCMP1244" /LENGTH=30 /DNA_ID= /DNA_START= /DNA_END= /DNA_ORIENTATION=
MRLVVAAVRRDRCPLPRSDAARPGSDAASA